jgi:hypothetical protein
MYGLRIDFPVTQLQKAPLIIPILVDFADAYGLLPGWNDKIFSVIFGGSCDGYESIAGNPFRLLKVACKLQSKVVYQEAMIHAVGINDKPGSNKSLCDPEWSKENGEHELYAYFEAHAKDFRD